MFMAQTVYEKVGNHIGQANQYPRRWLAKHPHYTNNPVVSVNASLPFGETCHKIPERSEKEETCSCRESSVDGS
jgi:hypothetical protein